jgi:hypothetical protein
MMARRILKWIGIVVVVLLAVAGGGLTYVLFALPRVTPLREVHVERTPARVARGEYLVSTMCFHCHSPRDWNKWSAPTLPNMEGTGAGEVWNHDNADLPGNFWAPNLTPTYLGQWTDAEIIRAFTEGVNRQGQPLFPLMPYSEFRLLPTEDVYSIVAYLRSLTPKPLPSHAATFQRRLDFPLSIIVHLIPQTAAPRTVNPADTLAYGHHLAQVYGCEECHSPTDDDHKKIAGREFSGGVQFPVPGVPGAHMRSANITPDMDAGIGSWSEDTFLARFALYAQPSAETLALKSLKRNTLMPWTDYAKIKREDLKAIYAYLRTIKAVSTKVQSFEATD